MALSFAWFPLEEIAKADGRRAFRVARSRLLNGAQPSSG